MLPLRTVIASLLVFSFLPTGAARAQDSPNTPRRGDAAWLLPHPEVDADPGVPTLEAIVGHSWAQEITSHAQIERYLEALAAAAPERSRLVRYGETYEGRGLYYLAITSPENFARLDAIQQDNLRLADADNLSPDEAREILARAPGLVWLAYSIHGNEVSSSDAALVTAYHLLADRSDKTRQALENLPPFHP